MEILSIGCLIPLVATDLQPIVTIKDVIRPISSDSNVLSREYFSHFVVRNEGHGPAIEIEMALLYSRREWLDTQRETMLRADESLEFKPILHRPEGSHCTFHLFLQHSGGSNQDNSSTANSQVVLNGR